MSRPAADLPFEAPPPLPSGAPSEWTYALVGNPNTGKTSVFNALTGLRQKVGNYAGVTVERKEGTAYSQHGKPLRIIDLPGAYALAARSPDEAVMQDVLLGRRRDTPRPDRVLCVADASQLERGLYLVTQVAELGLPVILVLNMVDVARARGLEIDCAQLERELGITVVPFVGHTGEGRIPLTLAMSRASLPSPQWHSPEPALFAAARREVAAALGAGGVDARRAGAEAFLLLTGGLAEPQGHTTPLPEAARTLAAAWQDRLDRESPGWRSDLAAARYARLREVARAVVRQGGRQGRDVTAAIDRVALHPVFGWLALAGVLWGLFYALFSLSEAPMGWIEESTAALGELVRGGLPEGDLRDLLVDGVIAGVGGVLVFLPQILILFFFLSLLEGSGYMARAAFLLDRVMGLVGLQGKSFIPLLSSYACAIPGIMAARTIENPRERLATILVAPLMTCSARLPVYAVMLATLFPGGEGAAAQRAWLLFGLYALGTAGAFGYAWLFRRTLLKGSAGGMVVELPPYRLPTFRWTALELLDRAKVFLTRAGTIILALSVVLWALSTYPKTDPAGLTPPPRLDEAATERWLAQQQAEHSFAGQLGKLVEPIFAPLGYDWRISVGVLASFAAREVLVSTLAITYATEDIEGEEGEAPLVETLRAQVRADGTPVFSLPTCLSLLVFYVFAMQCLSTVAVARRETNSWGWPIFMTAYMTVTAYVLALLAYQGGRALGL